MMYQKIAMALKKEGMNDESVSIDWLLFLCLGNREPCGSHFNDLATSSDEISSRLRASRRHLIFSFKDVDCRRFVLVSWYGQSKSTIA